MQLYKILYFTNQFKDRPGYQGGMQAKLILPDRHVNLATVLYFKGLPIVQSFKQEQVDWHFGRPVVH